MRINVIAVLILSLTSCLSSSAQDSLSYAQKAHIFKQLLVRGDFYLDSTDKFFFISNAAKDKLLYSETFFLKHLESNGISIISDAFEEDKSFTFYLDFEKNEVVNENWSLKSKNESGAISDGWIGSGVPFIYDHDFNLIGEFQEPKYSRILNQLLKSPKLDFDSTFKYLIVDDYSHLKWLNKDSSFLDYIEKQELEVTSKDKRNPLKHNTVEIGLDFTNQEVFITRTIFKEDELTGENIWIDTYESLYFRLDENDNLTQEPSYQYHSEVEKHNLLKSSLAVMNNNLDTTYSKIRLERSMFNQMKTDSMIMSFYEENNFRKNDMTIYLDFRYMPSKKLMRIFPESYYDDTQTGERVYSEFVIDNFHFKIEEYSKAVEITKEEYYRIFFEE